MVDWIEFSMVYFYDFCRISVSFARHRRRKKWEYGVLRNDEAFSAFDKNVRFHKQMVSAALGSYTLGVLLHTEQGERKPFWPEPEHLS